MRILTYGKKNRGYGAKATCDDGPGRIIVAGSTTSSTSLSGALPGLWPRGALERLRDESR